MATPIRYSCPHCGSELSALPEGMCDCTAPLSADHADPMHIRPYAPLQTAAGDVSATDPPTAPLALFRAYAPPEPARRPRPHRTTGRRRKPPARSRGRGRGQGQGRPVLFGGAAVLASALFVASYALTSGSGTPRADGFVEHARAGDGLRADGDDHAEGTDPTSAPVPSAPSSRTSTATPTKTPPPAPGPSHGAATERHQRPRTLTASGTRPAAPATARVLLPGDTGPDVAELERRLKQAGFLAADAPVEGLFTPLVHEAVFRYQVAEGLRGDPDGEYGPYTRRSLEARTHG
ncbi:peptidoglycan-binding protein [Streptomyces beihaiensis]|uniref:Peptidoglycan-binding protein n=1 Tax=Streptomyces beihaiensis TaxID=2984495 RepID=A0ABT3TRN5_9ACTN|nr:peptidoglycan-binding protein [Streptomyces beihaiensis]MCX3059708.1 peptidoglycan-binding protein [Streptomyces beihaiensis]